MYIVTSHYFDADVFLDLDDAFAYLRDYAPTILVRTRTGQTPMKDGRIVEVIDGAEVRVVYDSNTGY